jgi:hypothetical protein
VDGLVEFLTSTYTLVIVPIAAVIGALVAFWKTVIERRNAELETQKLKPEVAAVTGYIVPAHRRANREVRFSGEVRKESNPDWFDGLDYGASGVAGASEHCAGSERS